MCRDSSFLVMQPVTFKVFANKGFTVLVVSFWLISVTEYTLCYITEVWQEDEKVKIWFLCIAFNGRKVVNSLVCCRGLQLYSWYYYLLKFQYNLFLLMFAFDLPEISDLSSINLRPLTFAFLMFSGGIKREHWKEKG